MSTGPAWVPSRLNHLRRDHRGLPVPYVNAWGDADDPTRWTIAPDTTVRGDAIYFTDHGDTPDFTKQSPQRQRWCTAHGWCQVCGRPVSWKHRYLVLSSISAQVIDAQGREHLALTEPWLCENDARLAVDRCPGLIRRTRDDDLTLVKVERGDCQLAVSVGSLDTHPDTRRRPVAMWLKILLRPEALPPGIDLRVLDRRDAALAFEATA